MTDAIVFVARGPFAILASFDGCRPTLRLDVDAQGTAHCASAKTDCGSMDCARIPRARRHAVRPYGRIPVETSTPYLATYTPKDGLRLYQQGAEVPFVIADSFVPVAKTVRLTLQGRTVGRTVHTTVPTTPACGWRLKEPWE